MIYLSRKGKKLLEEKLLEIENEITSTYRMMGESTKIDNDLRENPEYLELQTKVSYSLPLEKQNIKEILNNSSIIEEQDFYKNYNGEEIIISSKVTLLSNDNQEIYLIVGYGEEDPFNNIISYTCEFAKCLIGRKINEEFIYKKMKIKIIEIAKI